MYSQERLGENQNCAILQGLFNGHNNYYVSIQ